MDDAGSELRADCYVRQARDSLPESIKGWIPGARLRHALARSLADVLDGLTNRERATGFRAAVPVPDATPEDYLLKVIALDRDRTFVAGARFRRNPAFFFVEVYACDFPIDGAQTLGEIVDAARLTFAVFSPPSLLVHVATGGVEERVVAESGARTDFVTLAGPIAALQRRDPPPHMERVTLAPARSAAFYPRYVAAYEDFHATFPHLGNLVHRDSREEIERHISRGPFFEVYVDGEWAGVIAAESATAHGMSGYSIVEEVLAPAHRGRGLAPAMQRRLIDTLPSADDEVLHGTISPENAPSLATARRVGRIEVMRTRWVTL